MELPTGCSEVELIPGGAHVDVTKETEPIFDQGYEKKSTKYEQIKRTCEIL